MTFKEKIRQLLIEYVVPYSFMDQALYFYHEQKHDRIATTNNILQRHRKEFILPKIPKPPKWLHLKRNLSFKSIPWKNGDVFENCNLSQITPDSDLFVGATDITIRSCQARNCKFGSGVRIEGGTNIMQGTFCTHIKPWLISQGLSTCSEFCVHYNALLDPHYDDSPKKQSYSGFDIKSIAPLGTGRKWNPITNEVTTSPTTM